jgi:hypothetical protein
MTEHYEKVRAAFLDRDSGGGSRWGQALLLTRGVAAWMRTVGQWLAPQLPPPPKTPVLAPTLPWKLRQPLVELMGQVILTVAKNAPS